MSRHASPTLIGGFVVGAFALLIIIILIFSNGKLYNHRSNKYVIYFEGSVNGLNVGAPVKLKGVAIGSVTDILVQYDMDNSRVLTPVIAEIDLSKVSDIRTKHLIHQPPKLDALIARGLRARLALQSLVTGQLYVDVNFYPEKPVQLVGEEDLEWPEIPSIPSSSEEIENTIDEAISEVRKLPIQETFEATLHSVQHIERLLGAPEAKASLIVLHDSLHDLQNLIRHLNDKVDPLTSSLELTLTNTRGLEQILNKRLEPFLSTSEKTLVMASETLNQAKSTMATMEAATDRKSALEDTLRELSAAARSIRSLTDTLERNPQTLIYGKDEVEEK